MIEFHGTPEWFSFPKKEVTKWLEKVAEEHQRKVERLSFSFLNDVEIQAANEKFLTHSYPTDIITFDYSENENLVGEILIGFETVESNAAELEIPNADEMCRVLAHGVLHLIGFDDQSDSQKIEMRNAEEKALLLRPEILQGKNV